MTKEEILDNCLINRFDEVDKSTMLKAMEAYKDQELSTLQAKYDKLKDSCEYLAEQLANHTWSDTNNRVRSKEHWLKQAGLND